MEIKMIAVDERRYANLLREKRPHAIRTEIGYKRALREVESLMARGQSLSREEAELVELWAVLIERFEEDRYTLKPISPPALIRELMTAHGMTRAELAALFPSKGIASEVLSGKREISKAQARKLAKVFHVPGFLFLNV
jgi:HTH-type transcriptional regulator/antitoxin HigA